MPDYKPISLVLILLGLFGSSISILLGFIWVPGIDPESVQQGSAESYRILFWHVSFAWCSFLAFLMLFVGSVLWYLKNDELSDPHVDFELLLNNSDGVAIFSGTVFGLFGKLFDKGKFTEINEIYSKIKEVFGDRFYLEIQRHNDTNENGFEKFNLKKSVELEIPIIATNEVFYLSKDMHEAHDALICIGNKTYINEKNRLKLSDQHYLKTNSEMSELLADIPEALENNYNFHLRFNFKLKKSRPILPSIANDQSKSPEDMLKKLARDGLKQRLINFIQKKNKLKNNAYS